MTCIVGITDGTTVTIGGDSAGSDGWHVSVRSDTKVFRIGPYVLGFTTSFRMGQLLRYSLRLGEPDTWDVDRFMSTSFIDAVRQCLKDGGYAMAGTKGQEEGGTFLVGVQGRLYAVHDDYQVGVAARGHDAVGSGYLAALGSLHTTAAITERPIPTQERVQLALQASADLTGTVRPPFTVLEAP